MPVAKQDPAGQQDPALREPGLEVNAQGELSGTVSCTFRRLRCGKRAKGRRTAGICYRRREVRMVNYVRKRGLKAKPQVLVQLEDFRQSGVHGRSSRAF